MESNFSLVNRITLADLMEGPPSEADEELRPNVCVAGTRAARSARERPLVLRSDEVGLLWDRRASLLEFTDFFGGSSSSSLSNKANLLKRLDSVGAVSLPPELCDPERFREEIRSAGTAGGG